MTCANWGLTVLALIVFAVTIWPTILGATASMWVAAICAILIIVIAWSMVECKACKAKLLSKKKKK